MIVIDVNVLIALFRSDHPDHAVSRDWWAKASANGVSVTVCDLAWVGFLRIVTNRRVFPDADDFADAWQFAESFTQNPLYIAAVSPSQQLITFAEVCREARCFGDLVTDAYIAAFARGIGAEVVTFDRDFRRFRDLRVVELN